MKKFSILLIALALLAPACGRRAGSEAAVRQALERYFASRANLNMQGMDMQVSGIKIRDDKAEADVHFRSKSDAKATLSIHYRLTRRQQRWEVDPPSAAHAGMPGGNMDLPSGHPPASPPPQSGELPPGHPPVKPK